MARGIRLVVLVLQSSHSVFNFTSPSSLGSTQAVRSLHIGVFADFDDLPLALTVLVANMHEQSGKAWKSGYGKKYSGKKDGEDPQAH
ncbi:hypothetical protein [Rhodoferax sp.]|uniref:hypothetical protein n=1 Tax=Rhodoferax sp. TaxID=50421 RepID=UPI0027312EFD|nr:hypothetical protein [Rhodoferax sp.]MDP1528120.1 hypothetical protein [Rhodoferax sp.]MDP1943172.1 hypothetical protein [Rhodoferax sp.]MDP2439998.1 hypothetical protein [Rhodoferax sp.]MDZ4208995.1 hypothetical protein [Rhodoferax sp.]